MRILALGLWLLPALAVAEVPRYRTTLDVKVDDPDRKVTVAILTDRVRAAKGLDACWRKPGKVKVQVLFDRGKVSAIEASGDRETEPCLVKVLRAVTLAGSAGRVAAMLELTGAVPPPTPPPAILESKARAELAHVLARDLAIDLRKLTGIQSLGTDASTGSGTVTSRGAGPGPAGEQPPSARPVAVDTQPAGPLGAYAADDLNRVIRARAGAFRACYQKELERAPGLGGKLVVRFKIGPDGAVASVRVDAAQTTLRSEAVASCVTAQVARLQFRPTGGIAEVTYPFLFSAG
jgi:hypothetical protein